MEIRPSDHSVDGPITALPKNSKSEIRSSKQRSKRKIPSQDDAVFSSDWRFFSWSLFRASSFEIRISWATPAYHPLALPARTLRPNARRGRRLFWNVPLAFGPQTCYYTHVQSKARAFHLNSIVGGVSDADDAPHLKLL
jgi:hypothetical protein